MAADEHALTIVAPMLRDTDDWHEPFDPPPPPDLLECFAVTLAVISAGWGVWFLGRWLLGV